MRVFSFLAVAFGVLALVLARQLYSSILTAPEGNARMAAIAGYIRTGSMAFLSRLYQVLGVYGAVVAALLLSVFASRGLGLWAALSFAAGASFSLLAGLFGMKAATYANVRTAEAARVHGMPEALALALDGGAVMGLCVAGLGIAGVGGLCLLAGGSSNETTLPTALHAFAAGASSIALFARMGGGIYTKAADVGSDIVGKVEFNIPEDDARNPGVIADNVGDNVGDVAGMGADIYESLVAALVAALAISLVAPLEDLRAVAPDAADSALRGIAAAIPLAVAGVGLVVSALSVLYVRRIRSKAPATVLRLALVLPPFATLAIVFLLLPLIGASPRAALAIGAGALGGVLVGLITDYYTSMHPVRAIARSSQTGPGTNVIQGLAVGLESCAAPLLTLCAVAWAANSVLGLYGIALAAVGMLACTALVMTVDAYGPIVDNGGGIAQMAHLEPHVRVITDELDAVGNTTAAIGKGFAIGSAVLTVVALFSAFHLEVDASRARQSLPPLELSLLDAEVLAGVLLGAILPCLVGAFTMRAVGRAAGQIVTEIRRQFKEIPGLLEPDSGAQPEPARIVDMATVAALREMLVPGALAVLAPAVIGFTFGAKALAGALVGALVVGATLSLLMANAGGAWDNAKKHIEKGGLAGQGKGSEAHKAAVVGDTVGDPFKDTSGPAVSILIKVMGVVSLLLAPLLV